MKSTMFYLSVIMFLIVCGTSCQKEKSGIFNISGVWVEKSPEKFDGISDTIVFMNDLSVKKHFLFNNWQYVIYNDTILFRQGDMRMKFHFSSINSNEIVIYNFIDRSITTQIKDIYFIKPN